MACPTCASDDHAACGAQHPTELLAFLTDFRTVATAPPGPAAGPEAATGPVAVLHGPASPGRPARPAPSLEQHHPEIPFAPEAGAPTERHRPYSAPPPAWASQGTAPAAMAIAPSSGALMPPFDRFPVDTGEGRRLGTTAQTLGLASVLVPPLAVAAVLSGLALTIMAVIRPTVPKVARATRGILTALVLAPLGFFGLVSGWSHLGPSVTDFSSGAQLHAVPVVAPGPNFTVVGSGPMSGLDRAGSGSAAGPGYAYGSSSDGLPIGQVVQVSNQSAYTHWTANGSADDRWTYLVLAPSPDLASSLFHQLAAALALDPGAKAFTPTAMPGGSGVELAVADGSGRTAEEVVGARTGSLVVFTKVWAGDPAGARALAVAQLQAQIARVPAALARLDVTGLASREGRHTFARHGTQKLVLADLAVMAVWLLLLAIWALVTVGRRVAHGRLPKPGWYSDPTGRFEHRAWNGARWTGRVHHHNRFSKDELPSS